MMDLKDLRKQLGNLEKDDILKVFGVEERRTTADYVMPAIGIFSVGLLVGAGLGLMLAPKSGRELRGELRHRLNGAEESKTTGLDAAARVGEGAARSV